MADFASSALGAVAQYGVDSAAAQAQAASGLQFKGRDLGLKGTNLAGQLKAPNLKEYLEKAQMMKTLSALKGGGKAMTQYQKLSVEQKKEATK